MSQVRIRAEAGSAQGGPAARAEGRRQFTLGGVLLALVVLYPLIHPALDQLLGTQTMLPMMQIALFVILALGLNIVVGFAGLLDLGYVAFFAIGAYTVGFLASPQSLLVQRGFSVPFWIAMPISVLTATLFGVILGAPTLRLRGDYLAIVTLAFGEIVPLAFLNLEQYTNGSRGMSQMARPALFGGYTSAIRSRPHLNGGGARGEHRSGVLVLADPDYRPAVDLPDPPHARLAPGRAWMAMREDEIAASTWALT